MLRKSLVAALALSTSIGVNAERKIVDKEAYLLHEKEIQAIVSGEDILKSMRRFGHGKINYRVSQNTLDQLPVPVTDDDFDIHPSNKVELGKLLFFDKILSGNQNDSCATCHHPFAWSGDGLSLPIGEGGDGIGVTRTTGYMETEVHERVPRNAPQIFNLGAKSFDIMFHDGRVRRDDSQPSGFLTPAGDDFPMGIENPLAAQAMFPITSAAEMAGQAGENSVADATAVDNLAGIDGVWEQLAERVHGIDDYVELFKDVYAEVSVADDITMVHIANAIGAFEGDIWRADNSAFDKFLRGEEEAMSPNQIAGMNLFYGDAGCASCHNGQFLTSNEFKSIGMPQIGPGKGDNLPGFRDGLDDFGRERETGDIADRYRFRVPSIRNALLTGPWGHAGAYNDLRTVIIHHLNPAEAVANYDQSQVILPYRRDLSALDFAVMNDDYSRNSLLSNLDIENVDLTEQQIDRLMDFMDAVTDRKSIDLRTDVPTKVPSGLPIFD